MDLLELAPEMLFRISLDIDLITVYHLSQTCSLWNAMLLNESFWKALLIRDCGVPPIIPTNWKEFYRIYLQVFGSGQIFSLTFNRFTRTKPIKAKYISAGFESDGFIGLDDQVLVFGSNYFGELGQGDNSQRPIPTPVLINQAELKAKMISTGGRHTLVIDLENQIWAFGANGEGQLGLDPVPEKGPTLLNHKGKYISAGIFHSAFIDLEENLWMTGHNNHGQLGLGHVNNVSTPTLVGMKAKQVCCGDAFTLVLDLDGNLWGFGRNESGQLGLGHFRDENRPLRVREMKFKQISCKTHHSLGIDLENQIWSWGLNDVGQLGFPDLGKHSSPQKIRLKGKEVSAGQVHSMFLDLEDRIWVTGGNYYGQLGTGDTRHKTQPVKIFIHKAKMISAGANQSYFTKY